ncbi:MAG: HEPN domain-containing protein [Desulfurococcales archaeon]|nr:HEPN domain-containing protein [Desulfurococcales archaeon]
MNITCEWLKKAANDLKASHLLLEDSLFSISCSTSG